MYQITVIVTIGWIWLPLLGYIFKWACHRHGFFFNLQWELHLPKICAALKGLNLSLYSQPKLANCQQPVFQKTLDTVFVCFVSCIIIWIFLDYRRYLNFLYAYKKRSFLIYCFWVRILVKLEIYRQEQNKDLYYTELGDY